MNILKKSQEYQLLRLRFYQEGGGHSDFILSKQKMLIGSASHCDIKLEDEHISFYHAIIFTTDSGARILDLDSVNGLYLNGERIRESYFNSGDILKIATLEFQIEEHFHDMPIEDPDNKKVKKILQKEILDYIPLKKPAGDLVLIDGEYCDIVFNDQNFSPIKELPIKSCELNFSSYVDIEEKTTFFPLEKTTDQMAICITTLTNGNLLSMEYFPIKNRTIFASATKNAKNTIVIETLESATKTPFIRIKGGNVQIWKLRGFDCENIKTATKNIFQDNESIAVSHDDIFSFRKETIQVMVEITNAPPQLRKIPFFEFDKQFAMRSCIVYGVFALLWLTVTFMININELKQEPQKEIAIIYKPAIRSEVSSEIKTNGEQDNNPDKTGVVENQKPKEPIKEAKAGEKQKTPPKQAAAKKAVTSKPKTEKAKPVIKTYDFQMASNLTNMLNNTNTVNDIKVNNNNIASNDGLTNAVTDKGSLKSKHTNSVGNLGSSANGKFATTSGAKGLGTKKGIDTTYVEPKTVVLGSMDPELLRKILQEYLPQFQHCYQQELSRNESIQGVVKLEFRIESTGKVSWVKILGKTPFSQPGKNCMTAVLKMIQFPKPKGGVVDVTQPLNFFSEKISGR